MYEKYWGMYRLPFENVPDPEFVYLSSKHDEALIRLLYATKSQKGAAMLTGEIGCGKTTTSRLFIQGLAADEYEIGLVANPMLAPMDFLKEILYQLGCDKTADTKTDLLRILNETMMENLQKNKKTLLIIDEAQAIDDVATFEELRLLLNFQLNDKFLLTLILIGQPELKEKVAQIEQLQSRIAISYHLRPLDLQDTARYIIFRLKKAGVKKAMFTKEAIKKIYVYTRGVPRRINNICDLSLLVGYSLQAKVIDSKLVQKVIDDET